MFAEPDRDRVTGEMERVGREGLRGRGPVGRTRAQAAREEARKS